MFNCIRKYTAKTITKLELKNAIKDQKDYLIVDVREPWECQEGMIETSVNIPYTKFHNAIMEHDATIAGKKLVLYCAHGVRAHKLADLAELKGYDVLVYQDGYGDWIKK